ncbi:MAG: hypothetical protein H6Q89_2298, partial [Myxococcaceae bacterium]|nr:hypothetical protein [Myxococcaceae bacterium]
MIEPAAAAEVAPSAAPPPTEGPRSELTIRAVVVGIGVAALVGALYPYVV